MDVIKVVGVVVFITFSCFIGYVMYRDFTSSNKAEKWADANGCQYLGNARDLARVEFFYCNEQVVMRLKK
jgi:hypothetical protein